jgi:hypothetical protein
MKKILKKTWGYIVIGATTLFSVIAAIFTIMFIFDRSQEEDKEELIEKDKEAVTNIKQDIKDEKITIDNSRDNYNKLLQGKL